MPQLQTIIKVLPKLSAFHLFLNAGIRSANHASVAGQPLEPSHAVVFPFLQQPQQLRLMNAILGLCGEAGELANKFKKMTFHGHDFDAVELSDDAGDCLWYIADICSALNIGLDQVSVNNIRKLKQRCPNGFSEKASRERTDE